MYTHIIMWVCPEDLKNGCLKMALVPYQAVRGRLQDQFSFFDFTLRLKILMSNPTRYNSNLKCENIVVVNEKNKDSCMKTII